MGYLARGWIALVERGGRGVLTARIAGSSGGFVDLVSAGSAVRHGVFPGGSGEWTFAFGSFAGKASPACAWGNRFKVKVVLGRVAF